MTAQKVDYHQYMASREWALKREAVKERAYDNACERCHDALIQSVHHLTYERLGHEAIDTDLIGTCNPCHKYLSAKIPSDPAIAVVLRLIESTGLTPAFLDPPHWETLIEWSTGPTTLGHYFHGDLLLTSERRANFWDDFMDDTRLVVPICQGVWYHCNSF